MLPDVTVKHVSNRFEHRIKLARFQESLSDYLSRSRWLSGVQDFKCHTTLIQFHKEAMVFSNDGLNLFKFKPLLWCYRQTFLYIVYIFQMEGLKTQTFNITNKKRKIIINWWGRKGLIKLSLKRDCPGQYPLPRNHPGSSPKNKSKCPNTPKNGRWDPIGINWFVTHAQTIKTCPLLEL